MVHETKTEARAANEKWLTPKDISELLQVSRATAYNIINKMEKDGGMVWRPTKRITRVNPKDLEKYLEQK